MSNRSPVIILLYILSLSIECVGSISVEPQRIAAFRDIVLPGCENFTRGGWPEHVIYSPNYPNKYYNDTECIRVIEAPEQYTIELDFREQFDIEENYLCDYDFLEVRDGPYGFSRLIDRYCGKKYPPLIRSTSRFLWLRFYSDDSIEKRGFKAVYSFVPDKVLDVEVNETQYMIKIDSGEMDGLLQTPEAYPHYVQEILNDTQPNQEIDCTWDILAPDDHIIRLFFMQFYINADNNCDENFVDIYDGTTQANHLIERICLSERVSKFITTRNRLFLRVHATSKFFLAMFEVLYTFITTGPCKKEEFDCGDNTCIDNSLVCNDRRDCDLVYDESRCIEVAVTEEPATKKNVNFIILGSVAGVLGTVVFISCAVTCHYKCKQWNNPEPEPEIIETREPVDRRNSVDMKLLANGHANCMERNSGAGGSVNFGNDNHNRNRPRHPRQPQDNNYAAAYDGFQNRVVGNGGIPSKTRSQEMVPRRFGENTDLLLPPPDPFKSTNNSNSDSSIYLSFQRSNGHIPVTVTIEKPRRNPNIRDLDFTNRTGSELETYDNRLSSFPSSEKTFDVLRRIASERQSRPRERGDKRERPSSTGSYSPRPDVVQEEKLSLHHLTPESSPLLKRKDKMRNNHTFYTENNEDNPPEIIATIPRGTRGKVYHLSV